MSDYPEEQRKSLAEVINRRRDSIINAYTEAIADVDTPLDRISDDERVMQLEVLLDGFQRALLTNDFGGIVQDIKAPLREHILYGAGLPAFSQAFAVLGTIFTREITEELSDIEGGAELLPLLNDLSKRAVAEAVDLSMEILLEVAKQSEAQFRLLFERSTDPMLIFDGEKRLRKVNPALEELIGLEVESPLPIADLLDRLHRDDRERMLSRYSAFQENGALSSGLEFKTVSRTGQEITLDARSFWVDPEDHASGFITILREITELERSERALRDEKEFTEAALDSLADSFVVFDLEGNPVRWNKTFREHTGYSDKEISSMTASDFFPEDEVRFVMKAFQEVVSTGKENYIEVNVLRKNGERVLSLLSGALLKDSEGNPRYLCGVGSNISEQKAMEKALRESEEAFRRLSDATFDGIIIHEKGEVIEADQTVVEMFGYERSEMLGKDVFSFVSPEFRDLGRKMAFSGSDETYQSAGIRKNGTTFPIEICGISTHYHGRNVRLVAVKDLTERMEAERAVRESQEKYRKLFDTSMDGIAYLTLLGSIKECNEAMAAMTGYSRDELTGMDVKQITPERWHDLDADVVKNQVLTRGYSDLYRKELQRKDGSILTVSLRVWRIDDETGNPMGMWSVVRDISHVVDAEERIERMNRELRAYASTISHDLRVPLAGIYGFALTLDKVARDKLAGIELECLESIVSNAKRMERIVDDLLDYEKLDRIEKKPERLDLNSIVSNAIETLKPLAKSSRAKIKMVDDLPQVQFPREGIYKVVANLLENAILYADEHRRPVIRIGGRQEDGAYVLYVKDNGRGIPSEQLTEIFEPFKRLGEGDVGSGLGLSIARKIMEQNRGEIWVESEPGKGSTFYVSIPTGG